VYAIVLLIVVAVLSLLITRIATIALSVTGMSHEAARFQARSALSGVGYTTREAESVVDHPVRRRIIMALMLAGNVGMVTAVAALLAGFLGAGGRQAAVRSALLVGSLAVLYLASRSQAVDRRLSRFIATAIGRFSDLETRDYAGLLHLSDGYTIQEFAVDEGHWMAGRTLRDCALGDEGAVVLGIARGNGGFLGGPDGDTEVCAGDTLIAYGHRDVFRQLAERRPGPPGEEAHRAGVDRHRTRKEQERNQDTTAT
jgi:hypothetical protein